jgi:ubiquinone/menaquinone biosynthesis C-methylase UbiE
MGQMEHEHAVHYALGHSTQEMERLRASAALSEPYTRQLFHVAGITLGLRVLDVGCGGGDISLLLAQLVGPTGRVIGVDRAPEALETAQRRAHDLDLPNVEFLLGDATDVAFAELFAEPFDAAVGRLVLMWCPDPVTVLQRVAAQIRPGGAIAFQEVDWSGYRALPPLPTWSQCTRWIIAALEYAGADPYMGLKLFATFASAGLPPPTLYANAAVVAAGDTLPLYAQHAAELVRSLLPEMERARIATAENVAVDTMAARLGDEVVASSATVVWQSMISAAVHKPAKE